jgi:hypothetical protein
MTVGGGTLERWRSEKTAAYLGSAAAAAEIDPRNAALFKNMAAGAEKQAGILAKDLGGTPDFTPALRARLIAKCIAAFGPRAMRPVLSASKVRGVSIYSGKTEAPAGHPWPKSVEEVGKRHRSFGGGTLRAGVFGVMTGSSPTPASSWALPALRSSRVSSSLPASPGCSPAPSPWPQVNSSPCCRSARCSSIRSRRKPRS